MDFSLTIYLLLATVVIISYPASFFAIYGESNELSAFAAISQYRRYFSIDRDAIGPHLYGRRPWTNDDWLGIIHVQEEAAAIHISMTI